MNDSMAQPDRTLAPLELSGWKTAANWTGAILIAFLFLISGLWKITDASGAAVRMAQAHIPESLSLPAAISFGIAETFGAVLILVPRFRRWGAWLCSILLVAFLVYFAANYSALRGGDCSCFPWIKRVVGPGFFISDAVMLLMAAAAGVWATPSAGLRSAVLILGAVSVFALVSYGVEATRQTGVKAPASISVEGKPYSLAEGKILIYYFDPTCLHCLDAAKRMAHYDWEPGVRIVVAPVQLREFAAGFLNDSGLKAVITSDAAALRKVFPFTDVPAAVALADGRERRALTQFNGDEPGATLRKLGFIR